MEQSFDVVRANPLLKRDFIKIAEAAEVFSRHNTEATANAALIRDVTTQRLDKWRRVWCKPEINRSCIDD